MIGTLCCNVYQLELTPVASLLQRNNMDYDSQLEKERDEYYDDAECCNNDDWVLWDDAANQVALLEIWKALNERFEVEDEYSDLERMALVKEVIRKVMWNAAKGHARQVMINREYVDDWNY